MKIDLTIQDILYAAILAFFFTWLIQNISKIFRIVITRPTEFDYQLKDISKIMKKCYSLFPKEIIQFHGKTFKRGMNVRVTTVQNKTFEGELIGLNNENMLCVLTNSNIVAHELDSIEDMKIIER